MKYGIREVCNMNFYKYENGVASTLAFTIDTAKTSTIESATTTVYAQGGQGNARLMAWEGERTLTFTVEDALFTKESIAALMGESFDTAGKISLKTTSTAGYYKIEAQTLIRDGDGEDKVATIVINKAKLQSNFNLPFTPTGDPMAFTFTFDAFPVNDEFLTIECDHFTSTATSDTVSSIVIIDDNSRYAANKTGSTRVTLSVGADGKISFGGTEITGTTVGEDESLTSLSTSLTRGQSITLTAGSSTTWYIV